MTRYWPALELRFTAAEAGGLAALHDRLAAALDDLRATAWQEFDRFWLVFFPTAADRDRAAGELSSMAGGAIAILSRDVEDEDWARRSQEDLEPVRVGRIVVAPPWAAARPPDSGDPVLTLAILPSMGFGTGHHASTRLCLALLQQVDLAGRRVVDVGTGSGVLALAAWRLRASSILALDDDEDAVAAARDNLSLNGADAEVELRRADFRTLDEVSGDVVLANLTGALLSREAPRLARMVAHGGSLIVSGLTADEEDTVVTAFGSLVSLAARETEAGWVGLRFCRTGL